jgi:opacity protein-like surface antigen
MRTGMAVLSLMTVTTSLFGQRAALREVHDRGSWGFNVIAARPVGQFRRAADLAGGVNLYAVSGSGFLGLRVEGGWMAYDVSNFENDWSTVSQIATLQFGPQIKIGGDGPARVYGFLMGGGSLFWSNVSRTGGCGCDEGRFLDGDATWTGTAGAGVQIMFSRKVGLDIGFRGIHHDVVEYVPANGLSQNPDGSFSGQRIRTPVTMRAAQIGVTIGIR